MAGRIIEMRKELYRLLTEEYKTPGNWDHIVNQIGMFRYVMIELYLCELGFFFFSFRSPVMIFSCLNGPAEFLYPSHLAWLRS